MKSTESMHVASFLGLLVVVGAADAQLPRLAPLAQFGCERCEGPLLFSRIQALDIAPDRRIVVANKTEPHVRIFDASGRPQAAFGRTGQGPAELETPMAISVALDGTVEVIDMSRRRLVRFGPAGEDRGSVALGGFASAGAFAPQGGHTVAVISAPGASVLKLLRVTGKEATLLLEVKEPDFPQRPLGNIEALSVAVAPDGSFVVGDGRGAYRIRRYKPDGTPAGEFGRTIAKLRRTPQEIRLESERRAKGIAAMQARIGQSAGMPIIRIPPERDYFDAYALQFDEKGRLWVQVGRGTPEQTIFDVFDPSGGYLGEVIVPVAVQEYALGAGLLAASAYDEEGVPQVRVWTTDGAEASRVR